MTIRITMGSFCFEAQVDQAIAVAILTALLK